MTREDLFEALNGLEDRDILAAASWKKRRFLQIGTAAAACLCLAATLLWPGEKPELGEATPDIAPEPGYGTNITVPGGNLPEGMDPITASITVFPASRTLAEVDPNHVSLLDLTEADVFQVEGLSHALPRILPEGYVFSNSDLYITRMKDGTEYKMLRLHYQKGEPKIVGSEVSGPNGGSTPAYYPADSFTLTVLNFEPKTEKPIHSPDKIS